MLQFIPEAMEESSELSCLRVRCDRRDLGELKDFLFFLLKSAGPKLPPISETALLTFFFSFSFLKVKRLFTFALLELPFF